LVISSSPFPQGVEKSILIVAELNKGAWGEKVTRGKNKHFLKAQLAQFKFELLQKKKITFYKFQT
jgi:hypothetical protein